MSLITQIFDLVWVVTTGYESCDLTKGYKSYLQVVKLSLTSEQGEQVTDSFSMRR